MQKRDFVLTLASTRLASCPPAIYILWTSLQRCLALSYDSEPQSQLVNTVTWAAVPAHQGGNEYGKEAKAPKSNSKWKTQRLRTTSPPDGWLLQRQAQDSVLLFLFSFLPSKMGKYNSSPYLILPSYLLASHFGPGQQDISISAVTGMHTPRSEVNKILFVLDVISPGNKEKVPSESMFCIFFFFLLCGCELYN